MKQQCLSMTMRECIDIADKESEAMGISGYGDKLLSLISNGHCFLFSSEHGFFILRPVAKESPRVHVDFAYSSSKRAFHYGMKEIMARAKEVGASEITFATKNVKLERVARLLGWTMKGTRDTGFSDWSFKVR